MDLIDVHHHIIPPFYLTENADRIAASRGGQLSAAWLEWSPERALAAMDRSSVATAVISLSTPGVWFGDARAARDMARRCNEYAAELERQFPRRFGRFATIPLPDVEGALKEIDYALDVLNADGIGLLTSYGDRWLGDPGFEDILRALNARKAVAFVHPTTPTCCRNLMPAVSPMIAEVPQDTTRAIANLLFTGAFQRYPDIRFVFTHAGGTLPMVACRMAQYAPANVADIAPHGIEHELRRLYYDIAGTAYRPAISALVSLAPIHRILFGSDHPYIPLSDTAAGLYQLGLADADCAAIGRENAIALIPRLANL